MSTVSAYVATSATEPLTKTSITRREPGPHDVVIDIKFAGICHSDIHTVKAEWGQPNFPVVVGHEIAGVVTEVGPEVTKYKVGDHAGVGCGTPCLAVPDGTLHFPGATARFGRIDVEQVVLFHDPAGDVMHGR